MTREEFLGYIDDYNSGDVTRVAAHYAPDAIFENYGGRHQGMEVIAFMSWLMTVVRMRIVPRLILIQDAHVALEADLEVTALADLPDLPIGSLRKGDHKVSRTFAMYETEGPVIRHVRLAGWPPADI